MAIRKKLTRKVYIREYDFNKIRNESLLWYTSANFEPIDLNYIQSTSVFNILKDTSWGEKINYQAMYKITKQPEFVKFFAREPTAMYTPRYLDWNWTTDDRGQVYIQARKNTPLSRFGLGVFEYNV